MNTTQHTGNSPAIRSSALEKRIKRHVRAKVQRFYAVIPPGFEETACRELAECGISAAQADRGAAFSGTWEDCWKAHHRTRIPARILVRLTQCTCIRFEQVERHFETFPWELWLQPFQNVEFQVESKRSALYHQGAIEERAQRCIDKRLRPWQAVASKTGFGPDAQTVYIRNVENRLTVSLDCSGELLYKRGYDKHVCAAPLRDNIAAAILREANVFECDTLVDPMAGSGTFGLEAILSLSGRGAGHFRHFAFEHFPVFRPAAYRYFLDNDAPSSGQENVQLKHIILCDSQNRPLSIMRHNLRQLAEAGVNTGQVKVEQADFFHTGREFISGKTLVVINPPYGARLKGKHKTRGFFGKLGQHLRQNWQGCSFAIIAPGQDAERALALSVSRKVLFRNGGIATALLMGTIQ